jgi:hypothetical protein
MVFFACRSAVYECYQDLVTQESWLQVQLAADDYVGWIDSKQHARSSEYYAVEAPRTTSASDVVQAASDATTKIPHVGCRLPLFRRHERMVLSHSSPRHQSRRHRPDVVPARRPQFAKWPHVPESALRVGGCYLRLDCPARASAALAGGHSARANLPAD